MSKVIIHGRPDLDAYRRGERFGVTQAKRFPEYVYGTSGHACLVHKVIALELHWWQHHYGHMERRDAPWAFAVTACGTRFLVGKKAATCTIPKPDAVLCGRCHGEGANFPRKRPHKGTVTRQEAHKRLGCVMDGTP